MTPIHLTTAQRRALMHALTDQEIVIRDGMRIDRDLAATAADVGIRQRASERLTAAYAELALNAELAALLQSPADQPERKEVQL